MADRDIPEEMADPKAVRPQGPPIIPQAPKVQTKSGRTFFLLGGVPTIGVKNRRRREGRKADRG